MATNSNAAVIEIESGLREVTGAPDAYDAMRRLCFTVMQASKQKKPPFKLKPLLDVLSVPFEYDNSGTGAAEASVSLRNGQLVLEIPRPHFGGSSGRSRRWRFSIAHEFAHILLIKTMGAKIVKLANHDKISYRFVEDLCDHGASHLLIPRLKLSEMLRRDGFSNSAVRQAAKQFDTSETAMLRAVQDFLPGGAIITLTRYRRNEQEKNEPRVSFCSSKYSQISSRPWLPKGCTMKHIDMKKRKDGNLVSIVLNDKVWNLDGIAVPWSFGPDQGNLRLASDSCPKQENACEGGSAIICAALGRLDRSLFDAGARAP